MKYKPKFSSNILISRSEHADKMMVSGTAQSATKIKKTLYHPWIKAVNGIVIYIHESALTMTHGSIVFIITYISGFGFISTSPSLSESENERYE